MDEKAKLERDAARWREIERLFGEAKTAACERIVQDLGLGDLDVEADSLASLIDASIRARSG
jgi:hypothetical protein